MKPKPWNTTQFKELEKEWYERLEKAGFKDVEKTVNGKSVLKQRASNCYRSADNIARENKQRYFELLGHAVSSEGDFKDGVELFVMEQRASGVSIRLICEELKKRGERNHRDTIRLIIRKFEKKWQIVKKK